MIGVLFRYDEIASELRAMAELAGGEFLEPGTDEQLKAAARQIEQLSRARGVQPWAMHRPVKTRTTTVRGGHNVHAEIKWIWELTAANHRRTHFALRGKTSTRIDIVRHVRRSNKNLLSWTMEMGDAGSPGAHFHVQIKNVPPGDNESEFDVPRIPGILCTPAEHLDFVLGELFQEKWERRQQSFFANQNAGG